MWRRHGYKTPVEYLAAKGGTTTGRAREDLETSKRLPLQPQVTEACKRGNLSPARAGAVSGAAAADPTAEGRLVEKATRSTVAELRDECARTRAAADPDPEATHRRIHQGRSLRRFTTPDGFWNLTARGTADDAARINAALDPVIEEIFGTARREGRREPHDAYAFDALVTLADRSRTGQSADPGTGANTPRGSVDANATDGNTGPGHAGQGSQRNPTGRRPSPTHLALLRLDVGALVRGAVEGDEYCEITGVGPVPVSVARRLLGDSILKLVITRGVDVLNVTHLGRGPTAAQRVALLWTSPQCTTQGCHRTRVEIDHRIPTHGGSAPVDPSERLRRSPSASTLPRPQDPPRLGPRARHRPKTARRPRRLPPPRQQPPTGTRTHRHHPSWTHSFLELRAVTARLRTARSPTALYAPAPC